MDENSINPRSYIVASRNVKESISLIDSGCCDSCHLVLHEPFILCNDLRCSNIDSPVESCSAEANKNSSAVNICSQCFAKGKEFSKHKNYHDYSIVKSDFPMLDSEWNAREEMLLLNALLQFGHGNWDDIARHVGSSKNSLDCKLHFDKFFIDDVTGDFSIHDCNFKESTRVDEPITCANATQDFAAAPFGAPMRPLAGSITFKELAGYNAARGDFDAEFENGMEVFLNDIEVNERMYEIVNDGENKRQVFKNLSDEREENEELIAQLSVAMLQVYKRKLKARSKRKRVVREYGLLNKSKAVRLPSRYPHLNNLPKYEQLFHYGSKLLCAFDFDYILEGLHHEMQLRKAVLHLQDYRQAGLTKLAAIQIFNKLKLSRERQLRELSTMPEGIQDWLLANIKKRHVSFYEDNTRPGRLLPTTLGATRRTYAPLDIVGLPKYDQLSKEERQICSDIRVVPQIYLQIKQVMVQECLKQDGLRLADIRPLVKIDVNKTRKLYDYFLEKEIIYQSNLQEEIT